MAATSADEASGTISLVLEKWKEGQIEQFSPVFRIGGYPWRLRVYSTDFNSHYLSLICDKSTEAELWKCTATVYTPANYPSDPSCALDFSSWNDNSHKPWHWVHSRREGYKFEIVIVTKNDGESWKRRPTLDLLSPRDGIFLIGDEKIYVNKESLASQSPFFDRLFNGDFKEKNMGEIPIGDVDYEEFANILKLTYGDSGASLTDQNVLRILELTDCFQLKIVEDRAINFILSSASSFSICQKFIIAEKNDRTPMKEFLLSQTFTKAEFKEILRDAEFLKLSEKSIRIILDRCCDEF